MATQWATRTFSPHAHNKDSYHVCVCACLRVCMCACVYVCVYFCAAWLLHYHLCSDPMMRILKRLKEVYLFIKAFSQPSWMGFLFPPLSTTTVRQFVTLDTNLQAAFNGLMPVLPALTPDLKNLGMFRRYINGTTGWIVDRHPIVARCSHRCPTRWCAASDGEERALTLRYLSDVWEYDRESTRGIPTEMVVEVCRQLGNPHTMRSLEELKKAQVAALRM